MLAANLPGVNKDSNLEQEEETGADKDDVEEDVDLLYPEEYAVFHYLGSGSAHIGMFLGKPDTD